MSPDRVWFPRIRGRGWALLSGALPAAAQPATPTARPLAERALPGRVKRATGLASLAWGLAAGVAVLAQVGD